MATLTHIHVLGDGVTGRAVTEKVNELEDFTLSTLEKADLIIASPGIPPHHYPSTQTPIISELEFAYQLFHRPTSTYRPKLICTTGTNGKTTITSLLSHALSIPSAGNIGTPLISFVDQDFGSEWIAVEASSYQLYSCQTFRPDIAIMLPITDDHLSWHKEFKHYANAKAKIFTAQTPNDTLIYPLHCKIIESLLANAHSSRQPFSDTDPQVHRIQTQLAGLHNKLNILAASKAIDATGLMTKTIEDRLQSFTSLPHRLEKISDHNSIRIYNDSKSTNPDSTIKAIESFSTPIRLILCGDDKGLDYSEFIPFLHDHVIQLIVFGGISKRLNDASSHHNPQFPCFLADSVDDAVQQALYEAEAGDIILFSPSSSSFDLYANYVERGTDFVRAVMDAIGQ